MTIRAAIYARYSSDLQCPTSIEDQVRKCREYAETHCLMIDDRHIFSDAAISGAAIVNRPRLQSMLAAAERKPRAFDVLLMDDSSRLSRDEADSSLIRRRLAFAGVRYIAVSQGLDSEDEQSPVLWTVHGIVDSLY